MTKDVIYIFDIDGCVMPNLFSNYELGELYNREQMITEINQNGKYIKLYPEFELFFKDNCSDSLFILFLTGRQDIPFKKLTEDQLAPLEKYYSFSVVYYPSYFTYEKEAYFKWKKGFLIDILKEFGSSYHYHIFDDLTEHFVDVRDFAHKNKFKCDLYKISDKGDWKKIQFLNIFTDKFLR